MSEDNVVNYWIFVLDENNCAITDSEKLSSDRDVFLTYLNEFTEKYIWNSAPFYLEVCESYTGDEIEGSISPCLHGSSNIGELLEDEWFITFLLLKLSGEFKRVVIRLCDSDGEFLLTEAADFLPRWAEYKNAAQQRVFLQGGSIHLIPPPGVGSFTPNSPPPTTVLPIMEGVTAVSSTPTETLASNYIQKAIQLKINKYPSSIRDEQHVSHLFVPVGVAALLKEYPTLVAPAVKAFADRDEMDAKALRVMRHFPPEQRVLTDVKFSKALYAKLSGSRYTPDRITGWNLPLPTDSKHKTHSLGMKLACGFELLVCHAGGVTPSSPTEEGGSLDTTNANPRWGKYKQALTERGYFRGELVGSKLYKELESNALRYFSNHLENNKREITKRMDTLSAGTVVIKLLGNVNKDLEYYKEREKRLVPQDDDSWLNISPEQLEEMLRTQGGGVGGADFSSEDQMQFSLDAFLKTTSDFEGAEVTDELKDKLKQLSNTSDKNRKPSTADRKKKPSLSVPRKISSQMRKVSSQSTTSNSSQMSSLSSKIELNADAFSDAYMNCVDTYFADDSYFECSDDESSGLSSYGEDDGEEDPMRKMSSGSGASRASSGIDADMKNVMKEMERQLRGTTAGEDLDSDDDIYEGDEFDDVENFQPVKVDPKTVEKLVRSYKEERGVSGVGPATTLFASLGLNPK